MLIGLAYVALWLAALAYLAHRRTHIAWGGPAASVSMAAALALLTVGLARRGWTAGHWPLTNRYEVALCTLWAIIALYLTLEASWHERQAGVFVSAVALLVASYAVTRPANARAIVPLLPVLRSAWLQVHVVSAAISYGAFGVAAGLGLCRVLSGRWGADASPEEWPLPDRMIDRMIRQVVAWGFPWLTLSMLAGGIWAQNAWGRYWGWDPKETWALITWLWYLLILHAQTLRRWRGRRVAGLAVAGFGVVLFTFIGVPWLVRTVRLQSLHGF